MKIHIRENVYAEEREHILRHRNPQYGLTKEEQKYLDALKLVAGQWVDVETEYLFNNQYNIANLRVFDRQIDGIENDIRPQYCQCGFCGHQQKMSEQTFCRECLGSPYLTQNDLKLLRLLPIFSPREYPELTGKELTVLLPLFVESQTKANAERHKQLRDKAYKKVRDKFQIATEEHDGFLWLLDNGISVENCIYYSHTRIFSFGWRTPVDYCVEKELRKQLVEFPYNYEIKVK